MRTGGDALVEATQAVGVDLVFGNPGTSEMAMVDSLAKSSMRSVLVLFEGVGAGAADGYARISGKPAVVLLHLGPGLANATAYLHDAKRAQSPVITWVGDHTTWLLPFDPPLRTDIVSIARGSSQWIRTVERADRMGDDAVAAVEGAIGLPGGVSTLIVPTDMQYAGVGERAVDPGNVDIRPQYAPLEPGHIQAAAKALRDAKKPMLLLGGTATDAEGLRTAGRIAEATGADLFIERMPRVARREPGLPVTQRMPYIPDDARAVYAQYDVVVCAGEDEPACYFGHPDDPSPRLTPDDATVVALAGFDSDMHAALDVLADELGATTPHARAEERAALEVPTTTALVPDTMTKTLAALLPDEAIVIDEGFTSTMLTPANESLFFNLAGAAPHDLLGFKGGAIGLATPLAAGAALAAPDRRVFAVDGDGSSMYTIQSLWTMARESLDVTVIICANHRYDVLKIELSHIAGAVNPPDAGLTDLSGPKIDHTKLAESMGVPGRSADSVESFAAALRESIATPGPMLIQAELP